ncbi:MAG: type I methionyl aminopeptidase [Bacteroidales bacterium]|jgi:methionyl aminopeptidase|nr:type I methionyl aminopeptidase [Bacteroidales bacterium]
MLYCKTDEEVEYLRESALLVSRVLAEIAKLVKPGVSTIYLDRIAEEFICDNGAIPSFKGYNGFPATLCTSVNAEVVHGIPSDYQLREGDIISIDCGVILNGWHGDSAYTFGVGEVSEDSKRLLEYTKASLEEGVKMAVAGNRIGDISNAVQLKAESGGFSVVRGLVGHGIGKKLHERPDVPNFGKKGSGQKLKKGIVICIEPMINAGKKETILMRDEWTVKAADGKPSAHYEYTVAVDKDKANVLTTFEYIEEVLYKGN